MEVEEGEKSMMIDLNEELFKQTHFQSMRAYQNKQNHHYISNVSSRKKHIYSSKTPAPQVDFVIFAFPGSDKVNDWFHGDDGEFGERAVDLEMFPFLQRIGEGKLAKVNQAFLDRFQKLLLESEFKKEVTKAVIEHKKKIVLTGHSSGGATAIFAALWILENFRRQRGIPILLHCITFGCPLVGNDVLSHALRREKWAGHFTHVVNQFDIVPRIMLAPFSSIQKQLPYILEIFQEKVATSMTTDHRNFNFSKMFSKKKNKDQVLDCGQDYSRDLAVAFFENVVVSASGVASYVANDLMVPESSFVGRLFGGGFVKVSPYRPFGTYVFRTRNGDQNLVVENPNAVLLLLFHFCQLSNEDQSLEDFALKSLDDNLSYDGLQLQNMVNLTELIDHLVTPDGTKNKALHELSARVRLSLLAAVEEEKRKKENEKRIDMLLRKAETDRKKIKRAKDEETKKENQKTMEELLHEIREYKQKHSEEGKTGYYDAFKVQDNSIDFTANVNRLLSASIFDEIVEMLIRGDLPDEYEGRVELVELGTEFRRLVEPLDIANYYRHDKGKDYFEKRPKRYKFTQRWYEYANRKPFLQVSESSFLAEIEQLMVDLEGPQRKSFDEVKERVANVETQVRKWFSDEKILGNDVFLPGSTLSKWWKGLPEAHKSQSVLLPMLSTLLP